MPTRSSVLFNIKREDIVGGTHLFIQWQKYHGIASLAYGLYAGGDTEKVYTGNWVLENSYYDGHSGCISWCIQ